VLENQKAIIDNQGTIKGNQEALAQIIKNQEKVRHKQDGNMRAKEIEAWQLQLHSFDWFSVPSVC